MYVSIPVLPVLIQHHADNIWCELGWWLVREFGGCGWDSKSPVLQATSCENDIGLKIDRKHWAPVVQLSVAAVMFFSSLLNTAQIHKPDSLLTASVCWRWYGKHRGIQSRLPTLRLFVYCLLILFTGKSVCINPVMHVHLCCCFTWLVLFIYPDVLSCACLLCVPPKGGGVRPLRPSLNPPLLIQSVISWNNWKF